MYEYRYIQNLINDNETEKLSLLEHIFRFQDDLLAVNDDGVLGDVLSDIYPVEMVISKTNISIAKTTFLDLSISIYRGTFLLKLYDKRNDYNFQVITFPFLDGNIPKAPSYGVYISQLVRYCHINNTFDGFLNDAKVLTQKLISQKFDKNGLKNKFSCFLERYYFLWAKFGKVIDVNMLGVL